MTLKCMDRVSQWLVVSQCKVKLIGQVLIKSKQELKQTMLKSITVRIQYNLIALDHLGGIIDHHESDVKFADKSKLASLR